MTLESKITCDSCGSDLSVESNRTGYRLVLKREAIKCPDKAVPNVMIYTPITSDKNFCGLGCLQRGLFMDKGD
jgi:hypothetical protein